MPEMLSVPQAPPAPSGAPDHAPSAGKETHGPPFKEVLKDHQARPAHAEGHKPHGDDSPKGTTPATDATTQQGEATDPAAPPATAVAEALALTFVAPATPVAATAAAPVAAAGTVAEAATPATTAPNAAVLAAVAETAAGVPAAVTGEADAAQPADAKPAGAIALPATATQADGKPVATAAVTAALATATTVLAEETPAVAPATTAPTAETPVAAAETKANQPAAAPAPAPAQAPVHQGGPAPAQAHQAPAPVAAPSPLNTAHAVERIQAMVHMANARGAAHARIELHPAELGGVTIQLQVAHDGLRAHIAADRPEALPLLQRAAADLQRTLEARGIDLSGLDFGLAPDAEAGASRDDGRAEGRENPFGGPGRPGSDEESEAVEATVSTTTRSVELPAGALVDVRA